MNAWLTYDGGAKGSSPTAPIGSGNYERNSKSTNEISKEEANRLRSKRNRLREKFNKTGSEDVRKEYIKIDRLYNDLIAKRAAARYKTDNDSPLAKKYNNAVDRYFKAYANYVNVDSRGKEKPAKRLRQAYVEANDYQIALNKQLHNLGKKLIPDLP